MQTQDCDMEYVYLCIFLYAFIRKRNKHGLRIAIQKVVGQICLQSSRLKADVLLSLSLSDTEKWELVYIWLKVFAFLPVWTRNLQLNQLSNENQIFH